jgi:hypothetical protein
MIGRANCQFAFLAILAALAATFATPARADTQPIFIPVALAPVSRDTPLALVALTVDAEIRAVNARTLISATTTFKLHNTDRLTDLQIPVGFPAWASDPYAFDPARLESFNVTLDGRKIKLEPTRAELKIGKEVRSVDWFTFTLPIEGDQKRTVRVDWEQDLGEDAFPRFTYGLVTGGGWKSAIGSARISLTFPAATTQDQIIAYDPPDPTFDGTTLTWLFQNYEPPANPSLTFIKPALWDDWLSRRRAAQQIPNDANARAALGTLWRQFALLDSPRRDAFYAQAVAENQAALRLDPNQRAARQSLALLYEARAGAPTGPRNAGYVLLAVEQWEKLADANARKQLAEDYFYLGLDAATRGAFVDAQAYYDKAAALAPAGAGPLYLPDRLAAQRRALNLQWARALIDQNEIALATQKARAALGDAFMQSFNPPAFYVSRAQVEMSAHARTMVFTLAPYAYNAAEMENALSGVGASLPDVDVTYTEEARTFALTLNVPFNNESDLANKLDRIAQTLGDRAEWSLARAVIAPDALAWKESDELWSRATSYREGVDLSAACRVFSAQAESVGLPNASDEETQLKRALLAYAQAGWQSALAQGRVTYRAGGNETRVSPCATREIALAASAWRIERVIATVIGLELVGGVILVVRWLYRKRGSRGAREQG